MNSEYLSVYKKLYRLSIKNKLQKLSPAQRRHKSLRIVRKVLSHSKFKKSRTIMIYVSFGTEVDTRALLRRALAMGKAVFVPKVDKNLKVMCACRISAMRDLERGHFGILEPDSSCERMTLSPDLMIVPAVALDKQGGRLGRGQAYFDKFLVQHKKSYKIGIIFREQLMESVPLDKHDQRLDEVLTDG